MSLEIIYQNKAVHQFNIDTDFSMIKSNDWDVENQDGEKEPIDVQIINFKSATTIENDLLYYFYRPIYIYSTTIEHIKAYGCKWCFALNYIHLPNMTSVGVQAFYACMSLAYLDVQNVVEVQDSAFAYCFNLKVVRMDKLKKVPQCCFYQCKSLQSCSFASVESIEHAGFSDCFSLSELRMPNLLKGDSHCIFTSQSDFKFVPKISYQLQTGLVYVQENSENTFPKQFESNSYFVSKQIASLSFQLKVLKTESKIIPKEAFMNSYNLTFVDIPNVVQIKQHAFYCCYSLKTVRCRRLKLIRGDAFNSCSYLQSINTSNVVQIQCSAFKNCFSLNNLDLSKLQVLEKQAFSRCYCAVNVRSSLKNHQTVKEQLKHARTECRIFITYGCRIKEIGGRLKLMGKKVKAFQRCVKQIE